MGTSGNWVKSSEYLNKEIDEEQHDVDDATFARSRCEIIYEKTAPAALSSILRLPLPITVPMCSFN